MEELPKNALFLVLHKLPPPSPQFGHLGPFSKTMFKRILPSSDDNDNDGNDIIVIIIVKKAKTFEQAPL